MSDCGIGAHCYSDTCESCVQAGRIKCQVCRLPATDGLVPDSATRPTLVCRRCKRVMDILDESPSLLGSPLTLIRGDETLWEFARRLQRELLPVVEEADSGGDPRPRLYP